MLNKTIHTVIICLALFILCPGDALAKEIDVKPFMEKFKKEKNPAKLRLLKWQRDFIEMEFPFTREQALEALAKAFPDLGEIERIGLLDDPATSYIIKDGEKRYFENIVKNSIYRTPKLAYKKTKGVKPLVGALWGQVFPDPGSGYPSRASQPYINPIDFQGNVTIDIPRKKLPKTAVVEIWVPLPLATASQKWPRVISLTPEKYLTTVPHLDGDIAFAHFSFPMEELKDDLNISVDFSFSHYQQRFIVDPEKVLPYDKDSSLYRQYTRSHANIAVTSEMRKTANRIVGRETNPYLAAQKIYRYIVDNIPYSFAPHLTLQALGIPESVFVLEHGHGDCGSQAMFFSALCRSLGIPARSSGGFQIVPGWAGTHFWTEFYLEGYGWIPVDPTVGEAADWTGEITEEERRTFKEHFFGNLDPYRFTIQKDVDTPLHPKPVESMFHEGWPTFVIQTPVITCPECKDNPYFILDEHMKITYFPVDQ